MTEFINICEFCVSEFKAKMSKTRFCSKKCRNKADREKNPDYYERYYHKNKPRLQKYHKKYYKKNKEHLITNAKNRYQENREQIIESKYQKLKEIYQECEQRFNEGTITDSTPTHKIFSYLNHHPEIKDRMLLIEFPELKKKQASIIFYYWQKITNEEYKISLTKEEQDHILHLFNHLK